MIFRWLKSRRELAAINVTLEAENEQLKAKLADAQDEVLFLRRCRAGFVSHSASLIAAIRAHQEMVGQQQFTPKRAALYATEDSDGQAERKPYEGKVTTFTRGFGL